MQDLATTVEEFRNLHRTIFGQPAPEGGPETLMPFPPGVDPIEHALAEAQHVRQLVERATFAPRLDAWTPPADSYAGEAAVVVRVEVPGVSREDIQVHIVGRQCIVRGERKPPQGPRETTPMSIERPWGFFERRFVLPAGCQVDGMTARYAEGVLEIHIPVQQASLQTERRIAVD